jgi:lipoate-protein ligase A
MSDSWRLIPLLQASGTVQMALDTWLLEQHRQGLHSPTLRFYTWNPVAISLGYSQQQTPEHWSRLTWQGVPVDLVRRPSGGRAVLHQGDLTYAVITSGLTGSRMQIYKTLCQFLVQGWRSLGVDLDYGHVGQGYIHNPSCFGTATVADLVLANGYKLIGSAQLRRGHAILQHGSIRLQQDPVLFQRVFEVESATPGFPPSLPEFPSLETIIATLVEAASQCFQVKIFVQPLSQTEWQTAIAEHAVMQK